MSGAVARPLPVPAPLAERYRAWRWEAVSRWPEQTTWRLSRPGGEERYAKVYRAEVHPSLGEEAARLRWARPHLPVPEVLEVGGDDQDGVDWLVTVGLPGLPATEPALAADPGSVVRALAEGLRRFHDDAPVEGCPFEFRLDTAFEHVGRRVAAGRVDADEDLHDEHRHLGLAGAVRELESLRPDGEDLVVCHGDYCPPNALVVGTTVVAYLDLGELGVADRWWDLAVATWATTWNYGPGYEDLFLDVYGARPDPRRQAFYRLLYDLAS